MTKKNKIFIYHFFSEPIKEEYTFGDDRKYLLEFSINDCKLRLYQDKDEFIEMLRIDIENPDRDPYFIAHYFKKYIQSILRLSYVMSFRFSKFQFLTVSEFDEGKEKPKVNTGTIKLQMENTNLIFNKEHFIGMLKQFSKKPTQIDLLSSSLDYISDPINSYSNLYKIIEYEFHASGDKGAKQILKNSAFKIIVGKFTYDKKTGNTLIDLIVDLRDKCNHLKNGKFGTKFGFSPSNINDIKEIQKFIPTMQKICAQVIDSGFQIL